MGSWFVSFSVTLVFFYLLGRKEFGACPSLIHRLLSSSQGLSLEFLTLPFFWKSKWFFKRKLDTYMERGQLFCRSTEKTDLRWTLCLFFFGTTGELRLSLLLIKEKSALELSLFF